MGRTSSRPARLSGVLLGPADYPRTAPLWLVVEALAVSFVGVLAVCAAGAVSVLAGLGRAQAEAAGVVVVGAVVLFLLVVRAGRLLVGAVAVAGLLLALMVPRATTDSVLAKLGERQDVVVTAVAYSGLESNRGRYLCSVRHPDGTPVAVRLWRGCGPALVPGDLIGMVYDPAGRVPPRGVESGAPLRRIARCLLLAAVCGVSCFFAVVRSYRLPPAPVPGGPHPR